MTSTTGRRWTWTGSASHRVYSVVVFIVLASLDNVAIGLVPPLVSPISRDLAVPESAIGAVTAASFLVSAVAGVGWAYRGDRTDRKRLLMVGTLLWAAGLVGTALSANWPAFLAAQLLASVGLGAVGSVGYSVVTDLISPRRRGLVMSLWGLSQGAGTLAGTLLGGALGGRDWHRPFWLLAGVGVGATCAYLFTYDVRRGQSEPELAQAFSSGAGYGYRIGRADLPAIAARRTNVWLVLQGLTAQVTFGSLVWLPRLLQAKAEALGYPQDTAILIGSLFAVLFQLGGVLSIIGGLVGDRLQRRTPRGRALVAAVGVIGGVPLYLALFYAQLRIDAPTDASGGAVARAVLSSVVTEPTMALTFLAALTALALTSANSPNWFALIADVNPPEHRATVYSAGNLVNGVGRAVGNGVVGVVFRALSTALPPPGNYAAGLALFQVFFVPTALMYYLAAGTSPADISAVRRLLRERGAAGGSGAADDGAADDSGPATADPAGASPATPPGTP
ncbi:MFS transporter [Planosporangium sp. 12N6]|uniref:MFS transporter n=1 Tax=Planosporangium spinosum TaxID=3402278 RepID=UPI003CF0BE27